MTPFWQDDHLTLYGGDCRAVLAELPAESVHCVVTSPPYWGLRDYGVGGQLGLEPTPEEYVANMVAVFREVRRVLRKDGTLWLNLGDSYASHDPGGYREGEFLNPGGRPPVKGQARNRAGNYRPGGLKPKDLVGIPWRVAFALQADGWYLRSDIVWSKANPMPESVTDRPTKSHEYLFLLTKSPRYFYDGDAVREGVYDLPEDASGGRVPRSARSTGRVVAMPTMFGSEDAGVESAQPGQGARQSAALGRDGSREGDEASARHLAGEARDDGVISPDPGGSRGEPTSPSITSGPGTTGQVLPRAADVDGGAFDADGRGVGGHPGGTGSPLPVLRTGEAIDDGSRDPGEQGRNAHEDERGGGLQAVQQSQARSVKVPGGWDRGPGGHGTIHRDGRTSAEYQDAELKPGRNLRSVWHLATEPYPGAHFATFPRKLVEPCVKAGTSERGVCPECGAPWERETSTEYVKSPVHGAGSVIGRHEASGANGWDGAGLPRLNKEVTTTGWRPTCDCKNEPDVTLSEWLPYRPVPAVVLDPFAGSGTSLLVAQSLGRRGVGIDLSPDYLKQALVRNAQTPLGLVG